MSTETRMAIEQSRPMPQRSESGASVRYETKVFSHWDRQALAEVNDAFTYEIAWRLGQPQYGLISRAITRPMEDSDVFSDIGCF